MIRPSWLTTCPARLIRPRVGTAKPAIRRNSVLLPHPDGPRSTVVWPGATLRETSWRIGVAPYPKDTRWMSMIAMASSHGGARPQPDQGRQGRQRQQHEEQGQGRHHRLGTVG